MGARRPPSTVALDAAYRDAYTTPLATGLFAHEPVADASVRAARGIAAMLRLAGRRVGVNAVLTTWPFLAVMVPTSAVDALDAMELQLANTCAACALPTVGLHDTLRLVYDTTREADENLDYRCTVAGLIDVALERHGYEPGSPRYAATRASLTTRFLADYHRDRLAAIDRSREGLEATLASLQWGQASRIQQEARRLATAREHVRLLRPAAQVLAASARVASALLLRAERRRYLGDHARVTLALRRAYHELSLAGLDHGHMLTPLRTDEVGPVLSHLETDAGRRRVLAALDRALACLGRPIDGSARFRLAELGLMLERCFFVPADSALLPPLVATARQAAGPLAPLLVAWLDADRRAEDEARDNGRALG